MFYPKWIENFDKEISNFIRNYKEKYCWKVKLHKPTTFCIMNVDKNHITQLISELYEMNVKVETGYVGEKFYKEKFMVNPQKKIKDNWLEFNIRLIDYSDNFIYAIKNMQIDDLFIIGKEETEDIGKYLKINVGNNDFMIATIKNIKAINDEEREKEKYILATEPIGIVTQETFKPGTSILPSPTEKVYIADDRVLQTIFMKNEKYNFELGKLVQDNNVKLCIDGNNFFGKHIGIVGSTGSGKSCTVAKILQQVVGIDNGKNLNKENTRNAHIVIFDIHSEYKSAFSIEANEKFSLNYLDVEKLKLPYWLMNSEELESLFI